MSRINELIQELCPDGVQFKTIEQLGVLYGGITGKSKNDFTGGNARFITYMNVFSNIAVDTTRSNFVKINGNERQRQLEKGDVLLTGSSENPDECGMSSVVIDEPTEPLYLNSFCFIFRLNNTDVFLPGFSKYLFRDSAIRKKINQTASGVTRFNVSKKRFAKILIPVPPIIVQKEIVNILDKFTQLEEELSDELSARRKQYEYYRSSLLASGQDVEYFSLQDLCTVITDGSHFSPKATEEGYYMPSVKDMRSNGFDLSLCKKISEKDYEVLVKNGCKPQKNDVLIAKDGSMLKHAFPVEEEQSLVVLSSIAILRTKLEIINPKYLAHYFGQEKFKEIVIRNFSSKGGVPRIVLKNFKKVKIPVPSLSKQNDIINILDAFDGLVNDINNGLPAEIKARRQQYEYYRTKLLTFQELSV